MLQRIHPRRLLLQAAILFAFLVFPVVIFAASLRSMPQPWSAHHFVSEAAGIHIPFEYVKGHIFLTVSVNGKPGYVFLLDTGTSVDVLNLNTSRELGIPMENITRARDMGLGGGKVSIAGARNLNLQVMGLKAQAVTVGDSVAIVDLSGLALVMHHRMDGILGYPMLLHYVVAINFATDQMVLWPERTFKYHGKGDVMRLVKARNRVPAIPVTVGTMNSKTRRAMVEVDTGSDASLLLYPKYAKRVHIDDAFFTQNTKMKPSEGYGLGGCFPVLPAVMASMTMGDVQVRHFIAFLMRTSPPVTRHKISGVLGTTVLENYKRVIFDVPHHQVIFELPPARPIPQTAKLENAAVIAQ